MTFINNNPYYLTFYNEQSIGSPYIDITTSDEFSSKDEVTLNVNDGEDDVLTIIGYGSAAVTSTTFNTTEDNSNVPILSLAETLKKNTNIFYNVTTYHSDNEWHVKVYYDSSLSYTISVSSGLTLSGRTTGGYNPIVKFLLHYDLDDGMFDAEKYTNENSVKFNISAPFNNIMGKFPIHFDLSGYKRYETARGESRTMNLGTYSDYCILPTTCGEFYTVNYSDYTIDYNTPIKGNFLTNNTERNIGYDEICALSVIGRDTMLLRLRILYYSPSGLFMASKDYNQLSYYHAETNSGRTDYYFNPSIALVENEKGKDVGYVEVVVIGGNDAEMSERLRLTVDSRCSNADTIYFVNKIGGIDWYTFRGTKTTTIEIDDNATYQSVYSNDDLTKHVGGVRYKSMEKMTNLTADKISHSEALWLDELASSRYAFIMDNYQFIEIIVDECDIEIDSSEKYGECSLTYYRGDSDL